MKSKIFIACLDKAIVSGKCVLESNVDAKILSAKDNLLKCEKEGKKFDFEVNEIKAFPHAFLLKEKKKPAKKKTKEDKPTKEDKE